MVFGPVWHFALAQKSPGIEFTSWGVLDIAIVQGLAPGFMFRPDQKTSASNYPVLEMSHVAIVG